MARETSVVTPERYSQGFDYLAYMNEIKVNKARFEGSTRAAFYQRTTSGPSKS